MSILDKLSKSEKEVAKYMIKGLPRKNIADKLFVTEKTIKYHITNIYKKLEVKSMGEFFVLFNEFPIIYKGDRKVSDYVERLPSNKVQANQVSTVKSQEERVRFVNESFGVSKTINQLQGMMNDVIKDEVTPATVNAACNCVARLNETIDVAIKAARFLGER